MNHDLDFSRINVDYLLQAGDVAKQDSELAAIFLGIPPETTRLLANTSPADLKQIHRLKEPLLTPRQTPHWWRRLFSAMNRNDVDEIKRVLEDTYGKA